MTDEQGEKKSWFGRLKAGLSLSRAKLADGITSAFRKRKLDAGALEELEELLIEADLGPATAARLVESFGRTRLNKDIDEREVRAALAGLMQEALDPYAAPLNIDPAHKPFVVLMVGVNGTGKTTTIGKMARLYARHGLSVMLAAGDTFRAAAVEQLQVWGARADVPVLTGAPQSDAAALAYQALEKAKADGVDLLLFDTAGRLHNKTDLMNELGKIVRVMKKIDPSAPHATLLVLDATTGQNAHAQVEIFQKMTPLSGLIVTKLDGSAKGGVLVALADRFHLPIHAIGVGEGADDLKPFKAAAFARALLGIEDEGTL